MEKRIQIGIKLPPSLLAEIDTYRKSLEFQPDRTEIIERAVIDWLRRRGSDDTAIAARKRKRT